MTSKLIPLWLFAVVSLVACPDKESAKPAAKTGGDATYTVRGKVTSLPAGPQGEVMIRHEAVPDFQAADGTKKTMPAMEMPFPVAPGVSLEGLAPGDVVQFTFRVNWTAKPRMQLTKIEKLPADTVLQL